MKTQKPVNQKSLYHSYADLYEKIMNNEIEVDRAEVAGKSLDGMNRSFALELKRSEISRDPIRTIEVKNFDHIPIEEGNKNNAD
jgi:hypothetical protein